MSWTQGVKLRDEFSKKVVELMENKKEADGCQFDGITWYPEDIKKDEFVAMYSKDGKWHHNIRYKIK